MMQNAMEDAAVNLFEGLRLRTVMYHATVDSDRFQSQLHDHEAAFRTET